MKRQAIGLTALALAAAVAGAAANETAQLTIRTGEAHEFHFDGKPSTGYRWLLNEGGSTGLDIVRLETLGYGEPYTQLLGASAPFTFRLTCTAPGIAQLQFDYVSPSGSSVGDTRTYEAHCE